MIQIDHLSIDIVAPDEDFPNALYANWDNFCRECIEHIIDEYFSPYDKDRVLYELGEINLDLGTITEENFYEEFPQRLREELIRKVSVGYLCPTDTLHTLSSRLDNLLFYLVHGYCMIEWTESFAGLDDDLDWLEKQPESFVHLAAEKIVNLCLSNEVALYRLLLQSGNHTFLRVIFSAALNPSIGNREQKFHALELFLEVRPLVVVQFVHETTDQTSLHEMADLLNSLSVWTIIKTAYAGQVNLESLTDWHLLYDWLTVNYSYLGQLVSTSLVSSSKEDFVCHLHQSLLTFIRKRHQLSYISTIELIRSFLLQVFGISLYEKVLDIIEQRRLSNLQKALSLTDAYTDDTYHKLEQLFHDLYMKEIIVRDLVPKDVTTPEALLGELSEQGCQESEKVHNLFTSLWTTSEGFISWIVDSSISSEEKQKIIQIAVSQSMKQWIPLVAGLKQNEKVLEWMVSALPVSVLQKGLSRIHHPHTSLLITIIGRCEAYGKELLNDVSEEERHKALSKSVLMYLQKENVLNQTFSVKDVVETFLSYYFLVNTGNPDFHSVNLWNNLYNLILDDTENGKYDGSVNPNHTSILKALINRTNEEVIGHYIDGKPLDIYKAVSKASAQYLQKEKLTSPLSREEVVDKFLSYLYEAQTGKEYGHRDRQWQKLHHQLLTEMELEESENKENTCSIDTLKSEHVSETVRLKIIQHYVWQKPQQLISFIRLSVAEDKLSADRWLQWLDSDSWLRLISSISLVKADLLNRTLKSLELTEDDQRLALANFLLKHSTDEWIYSTSEETVHEFISTMDTLYPKCINKLEAIKQQTRSRLGLPSGDNVDLSNDTLNLLMVHHAGLCLLAPWFPRLFSMLGYLNEEHRDFKNVEFKVRAIFLLQYLAYGKEGKYKEFELAFNRLLTALPEYIPLPQSLDLTAQEKETADAMIKGVKANWSNMSGTSVEGFRQSFIIRNGRIEQEDERWLLTVDAAPYDILLDNVPWGFRQIRFPWLRKYIQVKWHEEQMF